MKKYLLLLFVFFLAFSWWDYNFKYRRKIEIYNPNIYEGRNVTVLLTLNFTEVFGDKSNTNYTDIAFTWYNTSSGEEIEIPFIFEGSDATLKNYVDTSDLSNGVGKVWVRIPYVSPASYSGNVFANLSGNGFIVINNSLYGSIYNYTAFIDFKSLNNSGIRTIIHLEKILMLMIKDGDLVLRYYDSSNSAWVEVVLFSGISQGEWHRVAIRFLGGNNLTVFLDGNSVFETSISFSSQTVSPHVASHLGVCKAGCAGLYGAPFYENSVTNFFIGGLDNFYFYNRPLTDEEIENAFNNAYPQDYLYKIDFEDGSVSNAMLANVTVISENISPSTSILYVYYGNPDKNTILWDATDVFDYYYSDNFSDLQYCYPGYDCHPSATLTTDDQKGYPSPPSALVGDLSSNSYYDYPAYASIEITNSSPTDWYILDFFSKAYSTTSSSSVTNIVLYASLGIHNYRTGKLFPSVYDIFRGGVTKTDWLRKSFIINLPKETLFLGIGFQDFWSGYYNQKVWIDNIKVSKTLPGLSYTIFSEEKWDQEPPQISFDPYSSDWTSSLDVNISCQDNDICYELYYKIVNSTDNCPDDLSLYEKVSGNYVVISLPEGYIKICSKARDLSENWNSTESGIYKVDKTPPVTSLQPSSFSSTSKFNITATCSDNLSGCNKTFYYITNQTSCPDSGYLEYNGSIEISEEGRWYVCVYSVDNVGNTEEKRVFGPYILASGTNYLFLENMSKLVSDFNVTEFEILFFKRAKENFGIIFQYVNGSYYSVFYNNSYIYFLNCDQDDLCSILDKRNYFLKENSYITFGCKGGNVYMKEGYNSIFSSSWTCDSGRFGFVCKECYLGLIGLRIS